MSIAADNQTLVKDLQKFLNARHSARLEPDGWGGNSTRKELARVLPGFGQMPVSPPSSSTGLIVMPGLSKDVVVDARSAGQIETLLDPVHPYAAQLIAEAAAKGIEIKIISGTRSYAEQDALFRQATDGRDNNGNGKIDEAAERVTKAPAGYSGHNFGTDFDIGIFKDGKYLPESTLYDVVARLGLDIGLEPGAYWKGFVDKPHYSLRPAWAKGLSESAKLAEYRRLVAAGKSLF